jgi:hypothetical protein
MHTRHLVFVFVVCTSFSFLPGCNKSEDEKLSPQHEALIEEFKGYEAKQCACQDYACAQAVGKEIGARVVEVVRGSDNLPRGVKLRLGKIIERMTACANRTKQIETN